MFDRAFYNMKTNNNYNELVDYQVQSMNKSEPPFDTQAYKNYKALVDKEREKIDTSNLTEYIYKLGYKIDTLLSKIISQLDTIIKEDSEGENDIIEEENYLDNGILEDGQLPEESYNKGHILEEEK